MSAFGVLHAADDEGKPLCAADGIVMATTDHDAVGCRACKRLIAESQGASEVELAALARYPDGVVGNADARLAFVAGAEWAQARMGSRDE